MTESMKNILHPDAGDQAFPHAPADWSIEDAHRTAVNEALDFNTEHQEVIKALQGLFHREKQPSMRRVHDALDEHFHQRGGMRYLYRILPKGPVAQGCRLAGLKAPAGSTDLSFGSVQ